MRANLIVSISAGVLFSLNTLAQVPPSPTQLPKVTAPGAQRQQPPGRQLPGVIVGYVFWDASTVQNNPSAPCQGFSATVRTGTPPSGTTPSFEQFTDLGTFNNIFSSLGRIGSYSVCQYAVHNLPVEKDLQVQINIPPGDFKATVSPTTPPTANDVNRPIQIVNGKCNNLPPAVPSTSTLGNGWWTCGDYAYNVNFLLKTTSAITGLTTNGAQKVVSAGAPTPLLSSTASAGMIGSGSIQGASHGIVNPTPPQSSQTSPVMNVVNPTAPGTRQKVLTNTDVTQMLKSGLPESVIVSTIQSAKGQFDLSPAGCSALKQANASAKILSAMGDGSAQPCQAGAATSGVGGKTNLAAGHTMGVKLGAPQQGRKITNPKSTLQDSAIIAVLQKQRQFADTESSAMKLSIRPEGIQAPTGPSQTMAATGTSPLTPATAPAQASAFAGNTNPSTNHSSIGGLAASQLSNNLALTCSHDTSMRVLTVSGGSSSAVFTQDAQYNFYTITGCSFGNPGPNAKAYIYYQGIFHENFQIQEWSDNWIKLNLDPNLKGIDDQDNVTLVVQRDDGTQATKNGFRFYAARDTILLPVIPKNDFSLNRFRPDTAVINTWNPTYTSGSSASVVPNLPGLSAEVHWDAGGQTGNLVGGSDIYDFSHLHQTFTLQSASMEWVNLSCTDPNYNQFKNSQKDWSIDWYGNSGLQVGWQAQICNPTPGSCGGGGPVFQSDCFVGNPESNYGVDVWVAGPRGLDPWTGKPTS